MSIFRRDQDSPPIAPPTNAPRATAPPNAPAQVTETTLVAAGSKFSGVITGAAKVVINGVVEGELRVENLIVIGASGRVKGEVSATAVQLAGRVDGNIQASDRVEVLASGFLEGDVVSKRVAIAEGAVVNGKVQMTTSALEPTAAASDKGHSAGTEAAAANSANRQAAKVGK